VARQNNETSDRSSHPAAAVSSSSKSSHYNVEHRVVMDSDGVRIQITRFVKIGPDDDLDVDGANLADEGEFDFGSEVEMMFRAMADADDANEDIPDPNPDGINPNMLPGEDGRPSDIRSIEGQLDENDRIQMNLLNDGRRNDPDQVRNQRNAEHETTTTVVRATHVIKPRDSKRSSMPPRSVFAKLAPSRDRYTIVRDEL